MRFLCEQQVFFFHHLFFFFNPQKQYIFLYRALTEIAQFGDTSLPYKGLNSAIETLKQRLSDSKEQCKLELEYDSQKSIEEETKKTCAVGSGDENQAKNRSSLVIPFDRNRVILSPIPGREHTTYINASFIEGYDNVESFIIAQDPQEHTITDFWRMISEQSINTVVMLSEVYKANAAHFFGKERFFFFIHYRLATTSVHVIGPTMKSSMIIYW
jgi:protein-tyrosine phosphatase